MTAKFTSIKINNWKVLATFAIADSSKPTIAKIINAEVKTIEKTGVWVRLLIEAKVLGNKWSRPIAIGYRDAARIPALPVEAKAATAEATIKITPNSPGIQLRTTAAESATGVRLCWNSPIGKTATITIIPMT